MYIVKFTSKLHGPFAPGYAGDPGTSVNAGVWTPHSSVMRKQDARLFRRRKSAEKAAECNDCWEASILRVKEKPVRTGPSGYELCRALRGWRGIERVSDWIAIEEALSGVRDTRHAARLVSYLADLADETGMYEAELGNDYCQILGPGDAVIVVTDTTYKAKGGDQ